MDRRLAAELSRREGWDEAIEFAGRPHGFNLIWRGTIWIATDKRLIQASRPHWWRPRQPPSLLWSVAYDDITAIHGVRTRSDGASQSVTAIMLALGAEDLEMFFSPRNAEAILACVVNHTGLAVPPN